tara:strand:- start:1673 stop:2392 length:720 start_codon:yes stop_codon:yes gene_type:complete
MARRAEEQDKPPQSKRLKMRLDDLRTFQPLSDNQGVFFDSYKVGEYFMMLSGSAGTGKSFIALYKALEEVMDKGNSFNQVLIVRSAVQTRDVGFLKGSLEEKTSLYEEPYVQICATLFNRKDAYQRLKEQGFIEFTTTTAMRGMSFDNSVVILDECQNCTFQELDTVVTRIGHQSKILFVGDTGQNDLTKKSSEVTGMPIFIQIASSMKEFVRIHFTSADIVRSSLVKSYIIAKENLGF